MSQTHHPTKGNPASGAPNSSDSSALRHPNVVAAEERSIDLESSLAALELGRQRLTTCSLLERIQLAKECLNGVFHHVRPWVDACCEAKGIEGESSCRAEEIFLGPFTVARQLRLIIQALEDIGRYGSPRLPGLPRPDADGRLRVPVVPVRGLYDSLIFPRFKISAWMQPEVTRETLHRQDSSVREETARTSLVLGAGNVSSTPATDTFGKVFQGNRVVLLKMHPVNEYLGPIFERAFRPLIERGFLRIVYGGADVGAMAVSHPLVHDVHITGSIEAHDTIVWGPPGHQRDQRQAANKPLLNKPITSELGNVSPWIVVPGSYTASELRFQAENVAASIVNNASFACAATRVIVTSKNWPDRSKFLDLLRQVLAKTPRRKAYYPGAFERFERFTGQEMQYDADGTLPWTLLEDVDPKTPCPLFDQESFVCICAEVKLAGNSELDFLDRAVAFCNSNLWGTLCGAITVPRRFRRKADNESRFQDCVARFRYGCIGINQWPGLMFGLVSPGWGAFPGATLTDAESGIGRVHNTYMLHNVEKAVLDGPLTTYTKPIWFPSHAAPEPIAWAALRVYQDSSPTRLPALIYHALRGHFVRPI